MILCLSTSSPQTSVAWLSDDGNVIWSEQELTHNQATAFVFAVLQRRAVPLAQVRLFGADIGPGSFSGVRVGVTIAKTLAYANGKQVIGATAFDLVSHTAVVALPARRGEFLVREPGQPPFKSTDLSGTGAIGYPLEVPDYPHAERFGLILDQLTPQDPQGLVPQYLVEPSISMPKVPYRSVTP